MRFRELTQADVPALFPVRGATRENSLSREELADLGITEASVSAMLDITHRGWLCEMDARVVGFAMGNRRNGEIWVIAVLPDYESRGIGKELLRRVDDWLWSEGWPEIWLATGVEPTTRCHGFYRHQGWADREIRDGTRYMEKRKCTSKTVG
jgi:GNAT superfamily N-acetyltransferase